MKRHTQPTDSKVEDALQAEPNKKHKHMSNRIEEGNNTTCGEGKEIGASKQSTVVQKKFSK